MHNPMKRYKSRLNAFIRYRVPIIMSGCQEWYPTKTDLKLIEKLHKDVTNWICWSEPDYKKRLTQTTVAIVTLR